MQTDNRPVAIVTGASRGLGKAIALRLAKEGYDLSLAARSETALRDLQQELVNQGVSTLVTAVDLTDCDEREELVSRTIDKLGRVDLLVNNAAVMSLLKYVKTDWDDVGYQVDLNLEAPMHLTHLVLPHMLEKGAGKVVNISTIASSLRIPGLVTYSTTKAGLEQFTASLRKELEGTGVSVSAVIPGGIADTGMTNSVTARAGRSFDGMMEKGMMTPAEVANKVMSVIRNDKGEQLAAKGGAIFRAFPSIGEKLMTSAFTPIMEAAAESDLESGRKVSDPTLEESVA